MSKSAEVLKVQKQLESMEQVKFLLDHYFSDGIYARVMTIEAGDAVVGKVHKTNHLSILLEGEVTVTSKYGRARYTAPYIIHALKGDKRAVFAHTRAKYMTLHVTEHTDLAKIELETVENK